MQEKISCSQLRTKTLFFSKFKFPKVVFVVLVEISRELKFHENKRNRESFYMTIIEISKQQNKPTLILF